jgi:hypothetical protein
MTRETLASARRWVRGMLHDYFTAHPSAPPRTAQHFLDWLDRADAPASYRSLIGAETVLYRARFDLVRNALNSLARARVAKVSHTANVKGRTGVRAYSTQLPEERVCPECGCRCRA